MNPSLLGLPPPQALQGLLVLPLDLLPALRRPPHLVEDLLEVAHLAGEALHLRPGALVLRADRTQGRLEVLALGADRLELADLLLEVGVGGGKGGVLLHDARQLRLQVLALRRLELERVLQLLAGGLLLAVLEGDDAVLLLQVVEGADLLAEVAVGLLQVEVPLQVDAVVLLQGVVGDLQVALKLQPLFGDLTDA